MQVEITDSFLREETRNGYLVTTKMKKVWAVELNMLAVIDALCQKHDIPYFAGYGTLLGAVREGGFIPWDDDIDLLMLRKDYEKFRKVALEELPEPYIWQDWYNSHGKTWPFGKVRNSATTAIEFPDKPATFNQGIFIDIYPIDDARDDKEIGEAEKRMQREIFDCIMDPIKMLKGILAGEKYAIGNELVKELASDETKAQRLFESVAGQMAGHSAYLNFYADEILGNGRTYTKEAFNERIYRPFEGVEIPVPAGYDEILTKCYGDYMEPAQVPNNHTKHILLDAEKAYTEYL